MYEAIVFLPLIAAIVAGAITLFGVRATATLEGCRRPELKITSTVVHPKISGMARRPPTLARQ